MIQACLLYEPGEKNCELRQGETQRGQGRERENCNEHTDQENLDQRSKTEQGRGGRARETRTMDVGRTTSTNPRCPHTEFLKVL